mgnify:CR=1 FL=1
MSFQKKDRTFQPETRKFGPTLSSGVSPSFAEAISLALRTEWGASPSARKEVGLITGANERAVRNWFEAKNSPSGENLIRLLAHSNAVLTTVLTLSGREELLATINVMMLRDQLVELLESVDAARSISPRAGIPPPPRG